MQNMEDFIRLEWLELVVFTAKTNDCSDVQIKNNNFS